MAEPAEWTRSSPEIKNKIHRLAADNAKRKRVTFNDSRTTDENLSRRDYYIEPGWNRKAARTNMKLLFVAGPLVEGERIECKYQPDGTVWVYLISQTQNDLGTIPAGADGQKWQLGNSTGDQDSPNANERMMTHTLEFPGGRRDPLLIHMGALWNGRAGMSNVEAGYTVDDMVQPTPMRSQSPPNGDTRFPQRADGGDDCGSPVPLDRDLLELARQGGSSNIIQDIYRQQEQRNTERRNANGNGEDKRSRLGFMGSTKDFLPGYRRGGEAARLHNHNTANRDIGVAL